MKSGAEFSQDRKYRYALWRIWEPCAPMVMFIGLNPSTANETKSDPTITRCMNFAKDWGYGGFYMTNLFGLVSSNPDDLLTHPDPMGENEEWVRKIGGDMCKVMFAWGSFPQARKRAQEVINHFSPLGYALVINKDGSPRHPLYVLGNTKPIPYHGPAAVLPHH